MRLRYWLLPAALLCATLFFALNEKPAPAPADAAATAEPPRYAVTGAQWLRLDVNGEPEFRARAKSIEYFADESARLHGISLDALGSAHSPWTLSAPEGRSPPHEKRLELTGGVTAHGLADDGSPLVFDTERLWVDLLRRELYTEARVELRTELRRAAARGLRADFDGERVQLLNDVTVDYVPGG